MSGSNRNEQESCLKTSVFKQQPLKNAVLQGFSLKNRKTCEITNRVIEQVQVIQGEDAPPSQNQMASFTGIRISPLPPPSEMEKYEQLYPGAAKALFELVKEQSGHRMELEKTVIKGDSQRANVAQWLSFALGMTALTGGVILILKGKDGFGFAAIIGALATLLGAFFGGAILRKTERQNKAKTIKNSF